MADLSITFTNMSAATFKRSSYERHESAVDNDVTLPDETMKPREMQILAVNNQTPVGEGAATFWLCWLHESTSVRFGVKIDEGGQPFGMGWQPTWQVMSDRGRPDGNPSGPTTDHIPPTPTPGTKASVSISKPPRSLHTRRSRSLCSSSTCRRSKTPRKTGKRRWTLPGGTTMILAYPEADAARGFFAGFRTVSLWSSQTCIAEVSVVGDTVAAQQASLELLAQSMRGGYNTLAGGIADVLDIASAGLRDDVPDAAAELIRTLFADSDCLTYGEVEVFLAVEEEASLLDFITEAGAALLEALAL